MMAKTRKVRWRGRNQPLLYGAGSPQEREAFRYKKDMKKASVCSVIPENPIGRDDPHLPPV